MEKEREAKSRNDVEASPALIAVHPAGHSVAVAVGPELRVFDFLTGSEISLVEDDSVSRGHQPFHKDSIRAIRFGAKGTLFVSADDKTLKIWIWTPLSWFCHYTMSSKKKITAVATSNDGSYVCFADEHCIVWVVDLYKKPAQLLSHHCSIITSLEFSPDDRFILSADQDFKIRVTNFPNNPFNGAHQIQSICLGHTEFVSCLSFVPAPECAHGLLLSGSSDSRVRLWDISSGALLDTCDVAIKAGLLEPSGNAEEHRHAVTDLSTIRGGFVAVASQSLQGIVLLSCNVSAQTLSVAKLISFAAEAFVPTCLANCPCTKELWMVSNVSSLPGYNYSSLARVIVISGIGVEQEPVVLRDDKIPGGERLLKMFQGTASVEDKTVLAAAEAVKTDNRESRKKSRHD